MGLEPTQCEHYKILSLARLPVPTLLHNGQLPYLNILPRENLVVNTFIKKTCNKFWIGI